MTVHSETPKLDIEAFLRSHERKSLLRFITCGSVDDGKSTLIGRLLHETNAILDDQLTAVEADSRRHGAPGQSLDLALLVDGLAAEREQGITIDVAYRYFTTEKRKFIVADTPGHVQYTRNMVTGASTADVGIILIDARLGVLEQSRRHAYIASLLGIPHLLVARRVGDDEFAPMRGEVAIGDIDGDALLALGREAVDEEGEVDRLPRRAVPARGHLDGR